MFNFCTVLVSSDAVSNFMGSNKKGEWVLASLLPRGMNNPKKEELLICKKSSGKTTYIYNKGLIWHAV